MKRELILIDASWVIHRMWHAHKDLAVTLYSGVELKSGHVYGVSRLLCSLNAKYPDADLILCLDGFAKHGKSLNSDYKANRDHSVVATAFDDLGVIIECACAFNNVKVAFNKDLEADDIIAYLTQVNKDSYEKVIIYSADCDMLQLLALGENIFIAKEFDKSSSKLKLVGKLEYYTDTAYTDKFLGVDVAVLPLYRAIVGDGSDNLPGFPRIRKKLAKQMAETFYSFEALKEACLEPEKSKIAFPNGFDGFLDTLNTNYNIMRFRDASYLDGMGLYPHFYESNGTKNSSAMFSLYRIKSVSPVDVCIVDAKLEKVYLNLRDEINASWRRPQH